MPHVQEAFGRKSREAVSLERLCLTVPQGRENIHSRATSDFPLGGRRTPRCLGKNSQGIRLWEEPQHIKAVNPPPVLTISFTYKPFSDTILAASEIYFHPKNLSKRILPSSPCSGIGTYSNIVE